MIARTPLGIALTAMIVLSIIAIFVVPKPYQWVALVVAILLIAANYLRVFRTLRDERRRVDAVLAAHPGETAIGTGLVTLDGVSPADRSRVVAVIADRSGLSFRDGSDTEVAHVAAERILAIELGPLAPRRPRPAIVTLVDGPPLSFWVGSTEDKQAEAVVRLRAALASDRHNPL
ncbi:MAG: hypothetical protein ABI566_10020 [Pseudolysinimonas sp.]